MIALVATARFALVSLGSVLLAGLSLLSLPAMPQAGHASPGVDLSRDLTHWSADLDDPLFLPGLPWEPGDLRSSTFFVRNETDAPADVEVTLTRAPAAVPASDVYVTMAVETDATDRVALEPDESSHVVRLSELDPQETVAVTLSVELSPDAPAGTAVDDDVIDFRAAIEGGEDTDGDGILSTAHLELAPLFLGFAMIGAAAVASWSRGKSRRS